MLQSYRDVQRVWWRLAGGSITVTFLDFTIIGLYAFGMLAVGRYDSFRNQTTDDDLPGGRTMHP